jgi:tetratricopeptide (TPR) repeat protein
MGNKVGGGARFSLTKEPFVSKCKILFLAANPERTDHLALDEECREIDQKIRAAEYRDSLELVAQGAIRPDDLLQYLNQYKPHIVHFSGHGSPAEEIILLDRDRRPKPVSKAALQQLFLTLKDNIQLVVLNACFSRPQAEAIVEVIDCAIGMKRAIGDKAATTFAASFYRAIGFGRSVQNAFEQGQTALMVEGIPEEDTPVLLVREGVDPSQVFLVSEHQPVDDRRTEMVQVAPSRLRHGADKLFGREAELKRLDETWRNPAIRVVTLVAWGGVGKTSLVAHWASQLSQRNYEGARYFDWSFYSQGTREQGAASADPFISESLKFFGDEKMATSAALPWDKGARLAQLIAQRRTLLVLDGIEPLQHPPGPLAGQLKNLALTALLQGLAQRNPGLCLVTTRERVADLAPFRDTTAPEWGLHNLPTPAGVELLKTLGVRGTDAEYQRLVEDVGGHALTLTLLGNYLAKAHGGDIRRRNEVRFERADARLQGGHAFKTMAAYEKWLAKGGEGGQRQLAVLRLLGLFDRPADDGCLAALRREPAIAGLTEPLISLDEEDWNLTLSSLAACGLISVPSDRSAIDAHPLIREYFAKQLREKNPDAWRSAHRRLYEHLKDSTEYRPDTLEDLQPLYQAVAHGCQAGLHQKACDEVYWQRIQRGKERYSTDKLGAVGANLGAVACSFEQPWSRLAADLTESYKAWLLSEAAFFLRALGRLTEALEPMQAGLQMKIDQKDWVNAAISANNLSELELTLGEVPRAIRDAEQSVTYADRSGDAFERLSDRTGLGDALHQTGRRVDALALFREAEAMQAKAWPQYPLLYSLRGFHYCELLLDDAEHAAWQLMLNPKSSSAGRPATEDKSEIRNPKLQETCREVEQRAAQTIKIAEHNNWLLDIALDHLTLGRAALYHAILKQSAIDNRRLKIDQARQQLAAAVDGLRLAGTAHHIPRALLSRAWLRFLEGDLDGSRRDLDEAWQIAKRGPMRLFMADIHLYRVRLFRDKEELAKAAELIKKLGYGRRNEELQDAQAATKDW